MFLAEAWFLGLDWEAQSYEKAILSPFRNNIPKPLGF